jgi:hypothetical protein
MTEGNQGMAFYYKKPGVKARGKTREGLTKMGFRTEITEFTEKSIPFPGSTVPLFPGFPGNRFTLSAVPPYQPFLLYPYIT